MKRTTECVHCAKMYEPEYAPADDIWSRAFCSKSCHDTHQAKVKRMRELEEASMQLQQRMDYSFNPSIYDAPSAPADAYGAYGSTYDSSADTFHGGGGDFCGGGASGEW